MTLAEFYDELPSQWTGHRPGEDSGTRRVHEFRVGVLLPSRMEVDRLRADFARVLCPDPGHDGACPIRWSTGYVDGHHGEYEENDLYLHDIYGRLESAPGPWKPTRAARRTTARVQAGSVKNRLSPDRYRSCRDSRHARGPCCLCCWYDERGGQEAAQGTRDIDTARTSAGPCDAGQEPPGPAESAGPADGSRAVTAGRIRWAQLPPAVLAVVGDRLGVPFTATDTEHSAAAGVAALLSLSSGDRVFVKGQRERGPATGTVAGDEDGDWWGPDWSPVDELDLEQAVNPHLPASAPRILWRLDGHGWHLLAFEGLPGRDADYTPGSPDLAPVAAALAELAALSVPLDVRMPSAWDRWGYYCAPGEKELLHGAHLLHTDPASTNVLVDDGRARLVDWSWVAAGPSWIDPALWGMRLISTGRHSPEQAWRWAARVPGWSTADPKALAVFARAEARRWHDLATDQVPTAASIARAADVWTDFLTLRGGA